MACGAEVHDADVGVGFGGCFEELGHEEFGEEGVAHVVGAELDFVAFFCCGGLGGHYAGWDFCQRCLLNITTLRVTNEGTISKK